MATNRELSNKLASGEITSIKVGGTASGNLVVTQNEVSGIATNTTAISNLTDGTTAVDKTTYKVLTTEPAYQESTSYYKDGVMNIQMAYSDVTLQVGRESHVEVYNNTGATITNGTVIRYAGIASGNASVVPALADTYDNASGFGVATHDILTGSLGLVTTFGLVGDVDLSAFNLGDVVYLSDTVAGTMVTTAPDIATRIGIVFSNDAITGKLFVNPEANIALPTAIAMIKGRTINSYTLTAGTPLLLQDYASELNVVATTNFASGTLGILHAGIYNMSFSFSGTLSDEEIDVTWELWDVTNGVVAETFKTTSGRAANPSLVPMAESFTIPVNVLADNTVYSMRVTSTTDETLVLDQTAFSMTSLHIR